VIYEVSKKRWNRPDIVTEKEKRPKEKARNARTSGHKKVRLPNGLDRRTGLTLQKENGYSLVLYIIRYKLFKNPLHARHVHDGCLALDDSTRFLVAEHPPVLIRAYQTAVASECRDNQMLERFFEGL